MTQNDAAAQAGAAYGAALRSIVDAAESFARAFDAVFNRRPVVESPLVASGRPLYTSREIVMNPRDAIRLEKGIPSGVHGELDISLELIRRQIDRRAAEAVARIEGMHR